MAPKGFKAGDSFEDGDRTYYVVEVLADGNYISSVTPPSKRKKEDSK